MDQQTWKRKEYESWDEAFRGLTPEVRKQSVRVAAYTQALFVQACADSFCHDTPEGREQITGEYTDLAYKCGMYHQLGKALVPPEYQILQKDFTEEELAVYRKYTTDGRQLVASLQEMTLKRRDRNRPEGAELETENIPWLMIRESCQQHMERWDGTGYPDGRKGNEISPIAQIVGLAKELDRLSAETKSEDPFSEAYDRLRQQENTAFGSELIRVLNNARDRCRGVYNKFIHYTLTVPKTIPLVVKRKDRPMGLRYRPVVDAEGRVLAYDAEPWFSGLVQDSEALQTLAETEEALRRTELTADVTLYLMYEAADALLRIQNCTLHLNGVILPVLGDFYRQGSRMKALEQLFDDQPIERGKLMLTVPEELILTAGKGVAETLARYLRNGLTLVAEDCHPTDKLLAKVKELGIGMVRLAGDLPTEQMQHDRIRCFAAEGITLLAKGVNSTEQTAWLSAAGVTMFSGNINGIAVEEDEMIRDSLLRERVQV